MANILLIAIEITLIILFGIVAIHWIKKLVKFIKFVSIKLTGGKNNGM